MASTFLKDNFKSLNMSEEDKEKLKKFKGAVSDGEMDFIKSVTPGGSSLNAISNLQKLLEEDK
tara:strand:+ start:583 stop:771 length:189 start_codon:yes stop_codon:yes gene_type:complete